MRCEDPGLKYLFAPQVPSTTGTGRSTRGVGYIYYILYSEGFFKKRVKSLLRVHFWLTLTLAWTSLALWRIKNQFCFGVLFDCFWQICTSIVGADMYYVCMYIWYDMYVHFLIFLGHEYVQSYMYVYYVWMYATAHVMLMCVSCAHYRYTCTMCTWHTYIDMYVIMHVHMIHVPSFNSLVCKSFFCCFGHFFPSFNLFILYCGSVCTTTTSHTHSKGTL